MHVRPEVCPNCNQPANGLFVTTAGLVCFNCVPERDFARYPNWKARHALSEKRSQIAKRNFAKVGQE